MKRTTQRHTRTTKLPKGQACYVLITCDKPAPDGHMEVNMTFEGDAMLASYLIQGAQTLIDEKMEEDLVCHDSRLRLVK